MATLQQIQNELTKNSTVLRHAGFGLVYTGSDRKIHTILPNENTGLMDLDGLNIGGGTTVNPGNPDTGESDEDNYYAGSLANGEITDRDILWNGTSDPDKATVATLVKDPGSKFNMIGEGVMITAHLRKTIMTAGVKGAVSYMPIAYDPTNIAKSGYYISTSSYPAYVLASHFLIGKKLNIPFNGIGEHINGKNVKAPMLHLTFNEDKTLTIENETGYDNDGNAAGATGVNYDVIVDAISTYSTQTAVSQLPTTINLFVGQSSGEIMLSGISDYFENGMDGIEITFDDWMTGIGVSGLSLLMPIKCKQFNIPDKIRISKDELINGYKLDLSRMYNLNATYQDTSVNHNLTDEVAHRMTYYESDHKETFNSTAYFVDFKTAYIEIEKGAINVVSALNVSPGSYDVNGTHPFSLRIDKVVPYKE